MLKSFRKRLSQSGSRPSVARRASSRDNSLDALAADQRSRTRAAGAAAATTGVGHRSADDLDDLDDNDEAARRCAVVDYDCDSDDPFDSRFGDDDDVVMMDDELGPGPGGSRPATLERRKPLRRLHSASSATAALESRIDLDDVEDPRQLRHHQHSQQKQQQLGFKQRAKNFLLRRRSFGSLDAASQHRVDTGGGTGKPVRIDPRLVRGYAAKRHHSDDCVLDSAGGSDGFKDGGAKEVGAADGDGSNKKKHHKLFASRSLNFFASMRRSRSREARAGGRGSSASAASSEGGWTADVATGVGGGGGGGGGSDIGASSSGSGTLGRRGHRNSEQYMAAPVQGQQQQQQQRSSRQELSQQQQQHHQQPLAQRQMSSADALASNLNEISGISLERHQLRTQLDALFANWPAVPLDSAPAWLMGSSGSRKSSKRLSMAVGSSYGPYGASPSSSASSAAFNSGSLSRRRGAAGAVDAAAGGAGNLAASSSAFSHSTAEQLHLLCRQFNQAVTLRRSYRSKENLAARLQRRSSGNWSGSSGSSNKTAESKSFTKQLSNSTTASKDSALELRFEDDPHAGGARRPATTPASPASQHSGSSSHHHFAGHHQHQQPRPQHHQQHYNSAAGSPQHYQQHQYQQQHQQQQQQHKSPHRTSPQSFPVSPWMSPASGYPVSEQHRHRHHQQHPHQSYPRQQQQQLHSEGSGYWNSHQQQPHRPSSLNDASGNTGGASDGANGVPPVPPRRSTSLRNGRRHSSIGDDEQPENGPTSPTYLNQMTLAAMASPQDAPVSTAVPQPSRLDQISESPDETAPAQGPTASQQHPPSMPYRVHRLTKGQAETVPLPQEPQRSSMEESSAPSTYRQWRGSLPYPATPPPPRPRQPLLPTSSSSAIATGDSERIVREARAKLSQLNRLSAELLARKQLRPTAQPLACPFDSLATSESQQSVAGAASRLSSEGDYVLSFSAATNGSHHAVASSSEHRAAATNSQYPTAATNSQYPTAATNSQYHAAAATSPSYHPSAMGHFHVAYRGGGANNNNNNNSNWRNSLLLQDEAAVREYLKDLTAVCTTTGCQ